MTLDGERWKRQSGSIFSSSPPTK